MIVDSAIYVEGRRAPDEVPFDRLYETNQERGGVAWIGLHKPTQGEFDLAMAEFSLHELAVEDAIRAVASRCGYSAEGVERAYRARFWPEQTARPDHSAALRPARELDRSIEM